MCLWQDPNRTLDERSGPGDARARRRLYSAGDLDSPKQETANTVKPKVQPPVIKVTDQETIRYIMVYLFIKTAVLRTSLLSEYWTLVSKRYVRIKNTEWEPNSFSLTEIASYVSSLSEKYQLFYFPSILWTYLLKGLGLKKKLCL